MREAFSWSLETFLFYGGYPGAAPPVSDPRRWTRHISERLIETSISRDVLFLTRVEKPALLRRLFELARRYSVLEQTREPLDRSNAVTEDSLNRSQETQSLD